MNGNEEFVQEFLVECEENLDQLDQDLVALEENPRDPERLASIFRTIHTIKGTSGFFGFAKLGAVTHAGENLLGRLRDGQLILNPDLTNALLELVDAVRAILVAVEQGGVEGDGDYSSVITRLEVLAAQPATIELEATVSREPSDGAAAQQGDSADALSATRLEQPSVAQRDDVASATASDTVDIDSPDEDELAPADVATAGAATVERYRVASHGDALQKEVEVRQESVAESTAPQQDELEGGPAAPSLGTIRVDVGLLNDLMNQVGELVLARNQIRPFADSIDDHVFSNALQQLDLITGDLQEGIMKTRMQPIGNLWTRLPRLVRDLAQAKRKQVQLEMYGRETELDRTLIEAIKDPLTHLVRNAADHGIESPGVRRELGKPEVGSIVLRAFHEGGLVNIEISDDGAGIDSERVREKAVRQGLISAERARHLSDRQVTQLIFLPGLSTAEQVTDVSGRGVGMDVVKTNIERIGGSVEIDSRLGLGTTLRIKIPLTLAIIPALMVSSSEQRFAIPQVSLREIVTLFDGMSARAIEPLGDALVFRLRGELLPLIRLSDVLQLDPVAGQVVEESTHIVVLQAIGQRFGLIVDQVAETEEIVVKPLHKTLAQIPVFSGATVLGDGRLALILDVVGLARTAGIDSRQREGLDEQPDDAMSWDDDTSEFGDYLICEATPERRVAIPVEDVTRLEEFTGEQLGTHSGLPVIPYRDRLMPMLHLDGYEPSKALTDASIYAVVHGDGDRYVGLMVHRILDMSPALQTIDTSQQRPGLRGQTLIHGQVIDVVDMKALARSAGILFSNSSVSEGAS